VRRCFNSASGSKVKAHFGHSIGRFDRS